MGAYRDYCNKQDKTAQRHSVKKTPTPYLKAFNAGHGDRLSVGVGGMCVGHVTAFMLFLGVMRLSSVNPVSHRIVKLILKIPEMQPERPEPSVRVAVESQEEVIVVVGNGPGEQERSL